MSEAAEVVNTVTQAIRELAGDAAPSVERVIGEVSARGATLAWIVGGLGALTLASLVVSIVYLLRGVRAIRFHSDIGDHVVGIPAILGLVALSFTVSLLAHAINYIGQWLAPAAHLIGK